MEISVIATVRNEESSIGHLLDSLLSQTRLPDEVVIVDGGSTDHTVDVVRRYQSRGIPLRLQVLPGCNISEGRNAAVAAARGPIIACTDAGVRLHSDWLAALERALVDSSGRLKADVASGFFVPEADTVFECAMGATVLPALEDIRPDCFLPSSRSVAYTKLAWRTVGGYPDWLDYCEDVVFDLSLRRAGQQFIFAPQALVSFRPRGTLRAFFKQYYLYARGDGKAGLFARRHLIRYSSYSLGALAMLLGIWYKVTWLLLALAAAFYVRRPLTRLGPLAERLGRDDRVRAAAWIPIIRLTGDVAKMIGYPVGVWWRCRYGRSGGWAGGRHSQL